MTIRRDFRLPLNELTDQLIKSVLIRTNDTQQAMQYLIGENYQAAVKADDEIEIKDRRAVLNPEHISKSLVEKGISLRQLYVYTEDLEMFFLRTIRLNRL